MRYVLTGGQVNDVTQAVDLLRGLHGHAVVGDRAYDSEAVIGVVEQQRMLTVIPSRAHRRSARPLDRASYASRNVIERLFGRLKVFRRVATRYDKTAASYAAVLALAATVITLSGWTP